MDFSIKSNKPEVYRSSEDQNVLFNVDYHLVDRCNLNCVSCGHFCPLVPKDSIEYIDLDKAKRELQLLYEVTDQGKRINLVTLTGGEITLNPDLIDIVNFAVTLFPRKLRLWSNGLTPKKLLPLADLINHRLIELFFTDYGRSFTENAVEVMSQVCPDIEFLVDKPKGPDSIYFTKYFFSNKEVVHYPDTLKCEARYYCTQYVDGKLYVCQYLAYFKYFDEKFKGKHSIPWREGIGCIDLNSKPSLDVVINYLRTYSSAFCNHCLDCTRSNEIQLWKQSELDITEWYKTE